MILEQDQELGEKLMKHVNIPEDEDILLMGTKQIQTKVKEATSYIDADIAALATEQSSLLDEITQMTEYATHNVNYKGTFSYMLSDTALSRTARATNAWCFTRVF